MCLWKLRPEENLIYGKVNAYYNANLTPYVPMQNVDELKTSSNAAFFLEFEGFEGFFLKDFIFEQHKVTVKVVLRYMERQCSYLFNIYCKAFCFIPVIT